MCISCHSSQLMLLGTRYGLTLGIFPPGAVKTMQADTTCTTSAAGLPNDLSSPSEALSRELRAASACWMMGSAAPSSLAHSSWKEITSACTPQMLTGLSSSLAMLEEAGKDGRLLSRQICKGCQLPTRAHSIMPTCAQHKMAVCNSDRMTLLGMCQTPHFLMDVYPCGFWNLLQQYAGSPNYP